VYDVAFNTVKGERQMRRWFALAAVAALLVTAVWYAPTAFSGKEVKVDKKVKDAAQSVNDFALDLYGKLKEEEGNIFYSPSSIETALAMTYAGARGKTATEMKKTLHFTLEDKDLHPAMGKLEKILAQEKKGCTVTIANALWGQKGYSFLKEFLELNRKNYGAGLKEVDFKGATEEARKAINAWVEEKTKKKIKELLKPGILKPLTRLVLTNAIHFKGKWEKQFKKKDTKKQKFHLNKKKSVEVDMMQMKKQKFKYLKGDDFQVLELPYTGKNISMLIFLPDKIDGLSQFEKNLTGENLKKWISRMSKKKVDSLSIPRFKVTCEFSLADTLKEMGMATAFGMGADFSGMDGTKNLFLSAVIHKAFVDVNEEGTEAAAATAVVAELKSARPKRIIFNADHPFLFLIRDGRTGAILFMGRVADPGS
jgi:serpin B